MYRYLSPHVVEGDVPKTIPTVQTTSAESR